MQDPLETYVVNLLRVKGEPETAEVRTDLLKRVNDAVDQALIEALPIEQLDKLENATKESRVDDNLVEQLLNETGINSETVIRKALDSFRREYLEGEK